MLQSVSPALMQDAQILTGLSMAAFLAVGWIPALGRYAGTLRLGVLVVFLIGCAALLAAALL